MNSLKQIKFALAMLGLAAAPAMFGATDTATTTLSVTVAAEASITVTASPTLSKGGTEFEAYTGNTTFTYKVRTSPTTGTGSVTAQVTTEFTGTGAPTTADVSYTAATTGVGTANGSSTTASASAGTNVLSFGADAHSNDAGDSATISWSLADRPTYKTGTYSTTVTLTMSAT
ncbi:MAG TPA: hypothetical protein VM120_20225 [Bryobacteraceae bacterium]|nr:hypothetical protein [Bryobacteraceae bacterium]